MRTTIDGLLQRIATGGEITAMDVTEAFCDLQGENARLRAALIAFVPPNGKCRFMHHYYVREGKRNSCPTCDARAALAKE